MTDARREAAKGIPVWVGARIEATFTGRESGEQRTLPAVVVYVWPDGTVDARHRFAESVAGDPVLDLSDPDLQPAYLRRLAVKHGCPEEYAGIGISVVVVNEHVELAAGACYLFGMWTVAWATKWHVGTDDRILALARAWPR